MWMPDNIRWGHVSYFLVLGPNTATVGDDTADRRGIGDGARTRLRRVARIVDEVCAFQPFLEQLRCKEI